MEWRYRRKVDDEIHTYAPVAEEYVEQTGLLGLEPSHVVEADVEDDLPTGVGAWLRSPKMVFLIMATLVLGACCVLVLPPESLQRLLPEDTEVLNSRGLEKFAGSRLAAELAVGRASSRATAQAPLERRAADDISIPTLFCFAVVQSRGEEPLLVKNQLSLGAGIFSCESYSLFSDISLRIVGARGLSTVVATPLGERLQQPKGMVKDQTTSWLNTEIFIRAWAKVIKQGKFRDHPWVVKVDPDAVFLSWRLRRQLVALEMPSVLRNGVLPCFMHKPCPLSWLGKNSSGGYYCEDNHACRSGDAGPFSRDTSAMCQRPCYLGKPALMEPKPHERLLRNGVPPCDEQVPCPSKWSSPGGGGGYFCRSTGGCQGANGPIEAKACDNQCYVGKPAVKQTGLPLDERRPVYIKGCNMGFGFFGALEVISSKAIAEYAKFGRRCQLELDYEGWGEDMFMAKCFDLLGFEHIENFDMLADSYCGPPASPCTSGAVAFHPFKRSVDFLKCLQEAQQSDEATKRELLDRW